MDDEEIRRRSTLLLSPRMNHRRLSRKDLQITTYEKRETNDEKRERNDEKQVPMAERLRDLLTTKDVKSSYSISNNLAVDDEEDTMRDLFHKACGKIGAGG